MSSLSECASCGSSTAMSMTVVWFIFDVNCMGRPEFTEFTVLVVLWSKEMPISTRTRTTAVEIPCVKSRWESNNQNNDNQHEALTYSITTQPPTSGNATVADLYNLYITSCPTNVIRPDSISIDMRVFKLRLCCPFPYELLLVLTLNPQRPLYTIMILTTMRAVVTEFTTNDKKKNAVTAEEYQWGGGTLSTTILIL